MGLKTRVTRLTLEQRAREQRCLRCGGLCLDDLDGRRELWTLLDHPPPVHFPPLCTCPCCVEARAFYADTQRVLSRPIPLDVDPRLFPTAEFRREAERVAQERDLDLEAVIAEAEQMVARWG